MTISATNLMQLQGQTQSQMQSQDVSLKQRQVSSLGKSNLNEVEKEKKLREACEGFESIFIQKMWQQMRATLPQENPLVGREEKFWQGMYDQELSKKMASSGGIGLADMMYDQLSQNLLSASRTTASALHEKGFNAAATPLIPDAKGSMAGMDLEMGKKEAKPDMAEMLDIYEKPTANLASMNAGADHSAMGMPQAEGNNVTVVNQYLASLQSKQQQYNNANPQTLNGVQRAQMAKQVAGSPPPLNGVLPNGFSGEAQTVRTTFTTNIPGNSLSENQLRDRAQESLDKHLLQQMQETQKAQAAAQPSSSSPMQMQAPMQIPVSATTQAPVAHTAQPQAVSTATPATPTLATVQAPQTIRVEQVKVPAGKSLYEPING